jgi:hypothetical protein
MGSRLGPCILWSYSSCCWSVIAFGFATGTVSLAACSWSDGVLQKCSICFQVLV